MPTGDGKGNGIKHSRTVAGIELIYVSPGNYSYRDSNIVRVRFYGPNRRTVWMVIQTLTEYDTLEQAAIAVKAHVDEQFARRQKDAQAHELAMRMEKVRTAKGAGRHAIHATFRTGVQ